ncbi:MAG TPA: SDR family NAD(P)-dependent oxidoreductase [Acidimicrobiales bacterium]|nr:SDR family NAD(P)-dependent oxidoreductase [Acidimicrobiales bacterium]
MKELRDKVAVVTGGAGGIGKALCEELVAEGANVVVADVQDELLATTTKELCAKGNAIGVHGDVTDAASMEALADRTWSEFGGCHLLFNNAGVGAPSAKPWESTPNDWRWVFDVNVLGVANGVAAFVPRMIDGGDDGHIVNTSSPNGGFSYMPTAAVYAASKAAVSAYTEMLQNQFLADELKLRASVFYPSGGMLKTGMWTAESRRPAEYARERPRTTPSITVEVLEAKAKEGGYELPWQDLNELARVALQGVKDERFVIMIGADHVGAQLHARADQLGNGMCPPYESRGVL